MVDLCYSKCSDEENFSFIKNSPKIKFRPTVKLSVSVRFYNVSVVVQNKIKCNTFCLLKLHEFFYKRSGVRVTLSFLTRGRKTILGINNILVSSSRRCDILQKYQFANIERNKKHLSV